MKKSTRFILAGAALLLLIALLATAYVYRQELRNRIDLARMTGQPRFERRSGPRSDFIAHGGGIIDGRLKTNSLEAIDASQRAGVRLIELDFNWTSDGDLAVIHDWQESKQEWFDLPAGQMSMPDFKSTRSKTGLTQLSVNDLAEWLRRTDPQIRVVTDVKDDNSKALTLIARRFPDLRTRFIPQIYRFPEYWLARSLGFDDVILTVYRARYDDDAVLRFAELANPFAVTMPVERAMGPLPEKLRRIGIDTYAHGTEDQNAIARLFSNGVTGVYAGSRTTPP